MPLPPGFNVDRFVDNVSKALAGQLSGKRVRFVHTRSVSLPAPNAKRPARSYTEVKDGDVVTDYLGVKIAGYLSTFQGTTPADRDGDNVQPGAFTQSIPDFLKNSVLLANHTNSVATLAGVFTTVREDSKGLYFEADISDAPELRQTRFLIVEGHLKAVSMGGRFNYAADGRTITKVDLWEGSLIPIPANPDALFWVI